MKRRILAAAISVLALAACGPVTFTVSVEKKVSSDGNVDFCGSLPGILNLVQRNDADSALLSAMSFGIADRLETDLGLDSASVPVYTMYADEVNLTDSAEVSFLHLLTGVDYLIVADSLSVGDFSVSYTEEKAYVQNMFLRQTIVKLPYSVKVLVFGVDSVAPMADLSQSDMMEWTLLAEGEIPGLRAIEKVNGELGEYFRSIGVTIASELTPRWETVNKMLYVYDDEDWTEACRMAYLFEWEKAMDIWLTKADSPDTRKAACAAHNLSVACEILEMNDMAAKWKARSEELFNRR